MTRMGAPDPLQEAVEMLRRRGFDVTIIDEKRITVAGHDGDEKQIEIEEVRGGWRVTYENGNDSFATVADCADDVRQTADDWTAGRYGFSHHRMYDDLPAELQRCVDDLLRRDFDVSFAVLAGGVAFRGIRSDIGIIVKDCGQTWSVALGGDDRPTVDECWERPGCAADEVERWLDEFGD